LVLVLGYVGAGQPPAVALGRGALDDKAEEVKGDVLKVLLDEIILAEMRHVVLARVRLDHVKQFVHGHVTAERFH
jgi:hypothetical protein